MKKKQFDNFLCPEIKFAEGDDISQVQLLRAGKFSYFDGSTLEITKKTLSSLKKNFKSNVKKTDLAIDYFHASHADAAGWITDVILKEGGEQLWVLVDWTERAKEKILSKEIRYLSVDFDINYTDNESGKEHGPTLNGGGLTNRPFVKGMNPVLSEFIEKVDKNRLKAENDNNGLENIEVNEKEIGMTLSELKKEIVVLSDAQKKEIGDMLGLTSPDEAIKKENASLKVILSEKETTVKDLSKKIEDQEKEAAFAVLLSDGKAVPAQKDSYMKGDMAEFVKLAIPVNLEAKGSGKDVDADGKKEKAPETMEESEALVSKLADEKKSKDEKLTDLEAINLVLAEREDLKKLIV